MQKPGRLIATPLCQPGLCWPHDAPLPRRPHGQLQRAQRLARDVTPDRHMLSGRLVHSACRHDCLGRSGGGGPAGLRSQDSGPVVGTAAQRCSGRCHAAAGAAAEPPDGGHAQQAADSDTTAQVASSDGPAGQKQRTPRQRARRRALAAWKALWRSQTSSWRRIRRVSVPPIV